MSLLRNPSRDEGLPSVLGLLASPAFWLSAVVILHQMCVTHWFSTEWEKLRAAWNALVAPLMRLLQ